MHKQLKFAILEGNEEKAIGLYNAKEMGKPLKSTLHPSKPFPSKKDPDGETPLHLAAKQALPILFSMFLEFGGRPDIMNSRKESCAHTACSDLHLAEKRANIIDQVLKWRAVNPSTHVAVSVPLDATDIDGNAARHLAAYHGLLACVEKLIASRASSFVLNNNNLTPPEYADAHGRSNFGTMIELAALYGSSLTPGRAGHSLAMYTRALSEYNSNGMGVLVLESHSLTIPALMKFINKAIALVVDETKETPARAEVLLSSFQWDARRLIQQYERDPAAVLRSARLRERGRARSSSSGLALVVQEGKAHRLI